MNGRGGQDQHGDRLEPFVGAELAQHLPTVFLGQLHVQQDHVRLGRLGKYTFPAQKAEGLLAVANQAHPAADVLMFQRLDCDPCVVEIIFDQQDLGGTANRCATHDVGS